MNTPIDRPGIRFNDCVFSEPVPLARWTPPRCAGLYAILVADGNWAPKPFQPLYFGEFGNNATLPVIQKVDGSLLATPSGEGLLVSVLPLPFSTTTHRWLLRNELIWAYNPPLCVQGAETPAPTALVRKLEELERRHQEQTAELRMLFASAHNYFEPQPQPRRRIGFLPLSQTTA